MHAYMHACMHACIHTYMHACIHTYIRMHLETHTHAEQIHIYVYTYTYAYIYIYIYVQYMSTHVCLSTFINSGGTKPPFVVVPPVVTDLSCGPSVTGLCRGRMHRVLQSSNRSVAGVSVARRADSVTNSVAKRPPGPVTRQMIM